MGAKTDGPPLVRRRHGMKPPGSAGVPPAQSLAQPWPFPRPGSTGNGAMALLRPGPCGSRRQGDRLPHRRETERQAKGEDAGGTPALPGGPPPITLAPQGGGCRIARPRPVPIRQTRPASCPFVDNSFSLRVLGGCRIARPRPVPIRQTRPASCPFVDNSFSLRVP